MAAAKNWREVRAGAHLDEVRVADHRQHLDEEVRAFRLAEFGDDQLVLGN